MTLLVGWFASGNVAAEDPGPAGKLDILLPCGFEDDDWWRAWGSEKPP